MSKVSVEVAISKTYVVEGLQPNEVWDLINDEHTQSQYLSMIEAGNLEDSYSEGHIQIISTMEEE
tara:strand:+ start:382 stop:576 length:195 start_codon:yes stop_codon:yes gene_type:complete